MKARVLLVNPSHPESAGYFAPTMHLGLRYIAARLRQDGAVVKLLDGDAVPLSDAAYDAALADTAPHVVGFTATHLTLPLVYRMASRCRERLPQAITVIGGHHATFADRGILERCPAIDVVVRGEGEETMAELVDRVSGGSFPQGVAGTTTRRGSTIVREAPRNPLVNLDDLPPPARDDLDQMLKAPRAPAIGVLTSRGCPNACAFCSTPAFARASGAPAWRARSETAVAAEMAQLASHTGTRARLFFSDDNFIGPAPEQYPRLERLAEALERSCPGLRFEADCRSDALAAMPDALLRRLIRAGLDSVYLGLEAIDPAGLRQLGKGVTPRRNLMALKKARRAGLAAFRAGFILFHPDTSLEALPLNLKFLWRYGLTTYWSVSQRLKLFPGTAMASRLQEEGRFKPSLDHTNVYDYVFRDPRVGRMAASMGTLAERDEFRSSPAWVDFLMNLERSLSALNMDAGARRLRLVRRGMQGELHRLAMRACDLARAGWDEAAFSRLAERAAAGLRARADAAIASLDQLARLTGSGAIGG
ncbi:MAG: B12-binding domain-containing radical SAM protein [Acetobacteraceae bacterium]|nr:B12-binding domain-containing radical SAM protein [Acetobacteraceae bacterium]